MATVKKVPRPRKQVTNEELLIALANSDNENVFKSTARRYLGVLSKDEIELCKVHAVWRTLQYHREGYGQKFTTSLVQFAHWECLREIRRVKGSKACPAPVPTSTFSDEPVFTPSDDDMSHLRDRLALLPPDQQRVVDMYFFRGMTMEQIGQNSGYSKEAARTKLRKAMRSLKAACDE